MTPAQRFPRTTESHACATQNHAYKYESRGLHLNTSSGILKNMRKNALIIITIIVTIFSLHVTLELFLPAHSSDSYHEIEIPKKATFRQAVNILADEQLIRDKNIFLALGRISGIDKKILPGFYSIWGTMSPLDIFKALRDGQIIEYNIRVQEGDSIFDIADTFSEIGLLSKGDFIELSRDPEFLSFYDIESQSLEGYLYPDTYKVPKGISASETIAMMINKMREQYSDELLVRTDEIGMTVNEVLTLASIIEKEAVLDSERPVISAVYHNRLDLKMKLQADPTAIYGIIRSRKRITRADLLRKTPYNTYAFKGLPPGPIASPSIKSIVAALYPADVAYLFFVSKDDVSHYFSSTAKEHLEGVRLYREWKEELKSQPATTEQDDNTS